MPDERQLNLDVLRNYCGDLVLQIAMLKSENNELRKQVIELGRKMPPEQPDDPESNPG